MLSKEHAMDIWDPSGLFLRYYRVCADITEAAAFADFPKSMSRVIEPAIGKPVAVSNLISINLRPFNLIYFKIPKSDKGRGCEHALSFFADSERVWAETKYDGERAQIHVRVNKDSSSCITIFSKSRRESTLDRHAVHDIIRAALRLTDTCTGGCNVKQNVILDAEMVAFLGDDVHGKFNVNCI
jgi:DNA ligase-4